MEAKKNLLSGQTSVIIDTTSVSARESFPVTHSSGETRVHGKTGNQ